MGLAQPAPRSGSLSDGETRWTSAAAGTVAFLGVAPIAAGQGGYFPSAWGWLGLGACWVAAFSLVLSRDIMLTRLQCAAIGGAITLLLWNALSLLWTPSTTMTALTLERTMMYVTVLGAALVLSQRGAALGYVIGSWLAVSLISIYAIATHIFPERFGYYNDSIQAGRLYQPIGYWNALGIFCSIGMLLAVGLTDRPGSVVLRVLTGGSLPTTAATTYFTFSRGAWMSLIVAFLVVFAMSAHRLRYATTVLIAALFPAAAVLYVASLERLTSAASRPAQIEAAGGRAAIALSIATLGQAAVLAVFFWSQERFRPSLAVRRAYGAALVVIIGVAMLIGMTRVASSPVATLDRIKSEMTSPAGTPGDLNSRLFSASLSNRQHLWQAAVSDFVSHPILGAGAGTFVTYWLKHRPYPGFVVDAHSVYLQTLAELGVVGLAALLFMLVPALVAAARARDKPLVAPTLGAFSAYLVHAAVDWDWQMPAVTVLALVAAAALLSLPPPASSISLGLAGRAAVGGVIVAFGTAAGIGLAGNHALSIASSELSHAPRAAITNAEHARAMAPWSDQPLIVEGRAYAKLHEGSRARQSFLEAANMEPSDWVAWEGIAHLTRGPAHQHAVSRLLELDPKYDLDNNRP